ncbi:TraY domain-containing protein [Vibrio mediterranei]|uniref:TraY domain-containing protein n=1 Tax=Vibrio mediterranei TaxID=689 RepID=UPI001EFCBA18|nr:TraY domain-containing protein [Vibrio mediterranei]MCG9625413.1 TraY domain-containing protein [Vibrio mediterranei]
MNIFISPSVESKLTLDQQTYDLLHQASNQSYRSLKKEATIRLIDHAKRFKESPTREIETIVFKTSIKVPIAVNKQLTPCLYRGQYKVKTLVDEYSLRLKDHLLRYPTISAVGIAQEGTHGDT